MGRFHRTFGPSLGNLSRMPVSRQTPSRLGPSHCGQSSPRAGATADAPPSSVSARKTASRHIRYAFFVAETRCIIWSPEWNRGEWSALYWTSRVRLVFSARLRGGCPFLYLVCLTFVH